MKEQRFLDSHSRTNLVKELSDFVDVLVEVDVPQRSWSFTRVFQSLSDSFVQVLLFKSLQDSYRPTHTSHHALLVLMSPTGQQLRSHIPVLDRTPLPLATPT